MVQWWLCAGTSIWVRRNIYDGGSSRSESAVSKVAVAAAVQAAQGIAVEAAGNLPETSRCRPLSAPSQQNLASSCKCHCCRIVGSHVMVWAGKLMWVVASISVIGYGSIKRKWPQQGWNDLRWCWWDEIYVGHSIRALLIHLLLGLKCCHVHLTDNSLPSTSSNTCSISHAGLSVFLNWFLQEDLQGMAKLN